ncbi:hypothetical protein [Paraglaciecola sp. 25GB23A]|uniref:hypothetical protein n=1 Tax=Paraglaciecola sp. 25GB23A TaxID=3156068 RepID=UPI0032AFA014
MYKKIIWLLGGKWVASISSILCLLVLMGYQGSELLGQFVIGAFIVVYSDQFFNDAIENYILKLPSISRIELNQIIIISLILCTILVVPLALFLSYIFFLIYSNNDILSLSLASIPILFFHAIGHSLRAYLIKTNRDKIVALCQGFSAISALLIIITFIFTGTDYNLFYVYQFLLYGLYLLTYIIAVGDYKNYFGVFTFPLIDWNYFRFQFFNVSLNIFTNRLDTFAIGAFLNIGDAGTYAFLKRLVQVVQEFFGGTFDKVFLSLGFTNTEEDKNKVIYSQALLVLPIYTLLSIYGTSLISLLYNEDTWKNLQYVLVILCGGGVFRALILIERAGKLKVLAYKNLLTVRVIELVLVIVSIVVAIFFMQVTLLVFANIFLLKNIIAYILTANDDNKIHINLAYLSKILIKISPIILGCLFIGFLSQQLNTWFMPNSILSYLLISTLLLAIYISIFFGITRLNKK